MYWFAGNSTAQQMSTAKLQVLSKSLKKSMVTKGLELILSHNIEQFTNLLHFRESIYECWESVVRRCSKEKLQSRTKNIETFSGFGVASLHNKRNKTRFLSLQMECPSCPTSCRTTKALGNNEISKPHKCLELKRSAQLAPWIENFGNYARKL